MILAFAFLLKLSFDRGWITPALRLAAGFGTATALLLLGMRVDRTRDRLGEVLMGGGVALLYLTGYAGHQLYGLLSFGLAFSLMAATTLVAVALAEIREAASLSVIGVLGGLATPFLIHEGPANRTALALYVAAVLLGGAAVLYRRGWGSLLLAMFVTGPIALIPVVFDGAFSGRATPAATLPILAWAMAVVAVPLLRPVSRGQAGAGGVRAGGGDTRGAPVGGAPAGSPPSDDDPAAARSRLRRLRALWGLRISVIGGALLAATFLAVAWRVEEGWAGLVFLGVAAALAGVAWWIGQSPGDGARGHAATNARPRARSLAVAAEAAAAVAAPAVWLLAGGDSAGLLAVTVLAAALFALPERGAPPTVAWVGHVLMAGAALQFISEEQRWLLTPPDPLRPGAFLRLGAVVMTLVSGRILTGLPGRVHLLAAHVALLVWSAYELGALAGGVAWVSVAWAVQGIVVLLLGLRSGSDAMRSTGLATLALVAGKLLLVDLAQLDPVWRILLFLGFGAALLGLGWVVEGRGAGPGTATGSRD